MSLLKLSKSVFWFSVTLVCAGLFLWVFSVDAIAGNSDEKEYIVVFKESQNESKQTSILHNKGAKAGKDVDLINARVTKLTATEAKRLDRSSGVS